MHGYIESFCHIHSTHKHFRPIPKEVVNGFQDSKCTHIARYVRLVSKLEVMESEGVPKEEDDNPVKTLENKATDCN